MASSERIESLPLAAAVKPRLRGVSHLFAFVAALGGCFFLALAPADGAQHTAGLVFGVSLALMFGISATYHRPTWSHATYRRIQRFDHAAIYVLIAGTFTLGAAVYARKWPNPEPAVFGYHELFHVMVIAAAATHYAIILDVLWSR